MGESTIINWIIPFLSVGKRGFKSNFDLATIFLLILKFSRGQKQGYNGENFQLRSILKKVKSLGKMSITTPAGASVSLVSLLPLIHCLISNRA